MPLPFEMTYIVSSGALNSTRKKRHNPSIKVDVPSGGVPSQSTVP